MLDLSYNRITHIEGLSGLLIQELNLRGNSISDISGLGINDLPRLSVLDLAENRIMTVVAFKECKNLEFLDLRDNKISILRQVEYLKDLEYLQVLYLLGNIGSRKNFYRYFGIFCNKYSIISFP